MTQRLLAIAVVTALLGLVPSAQTPPKPVDLAGTWLMTLDMAMGVSEPTLTLKQDGEKLTGTYAGRYGSFPVTGSVKVRQVEFMFTMSAEGQPVEMSFKGEAAADGQSMKGDATLGQIGEASWTAKRDKEQ